MSYTEVGERLKVDRRTVSRVFQRWETEQTIERRKVPGRPRKTSAQDDLAIIISVKRNRFITAKQIKDQCSLPNVCYNTIRNRIKESGEFSSYWAATKPYISISNRKKRVKWCQDHLNWTREEWHRVMWTDESPFTLRYCRAKRVWRMEGERYSPNCTRGTLKHDIKINVWGAFCARGVGRLVFIQGVMDQDVYLDILEEPMLHSADLLLGRHNWWFQQDNDPKHTAKRVKEWLIDHQIPLMPWPSQSPDLNPIENLWSILDRMCQNREANTKEELFKLLENAWYSIPTSTLENLVDSMPERCRAVIQAKGGLTKY